MVRTRVGYAGGTKKNPTYHSLGDHTETVQLDYDPARISYEDLLMVFWASHSPTRPPWSRQYKSVVFYHNDEQKRLVLETKAREEARIGAGLYTEIVPAGEFYLAEDYHQKYYLRGYPHFEGEIAAIYRDDQALVDSTAAARVNGYLAGYGTPEGLQAELDDLGLSPAGRQELLSVVRQRRPGQAKGCG